MKYFIKAMRPNQWIKNFFIFAGLIFSGNLFNVDLVIRSIGVLFLFCLVAGSSYIINDVLDLESDRKHKEKAQRPLAAGQLKVSHGLTGAVIIVLVAIATSFVLGFNFAMVLITYFLMNLLYSLYLKKLVIIDVLVISLGFVLRVLGGILAIGAVPTPWIIMCTIFLSLFIALCKRKQEIVFLEKDTSLHRGILKKYTLTYLDQLINFSSTATVFSYVMFTAISGRNINLMYTIPFVLYGVMRYMYLVFVEKKTFSPTDALMQDQPLQRTVIIWLFSIILILYLGHVQ